MDDDMCLSYTIMHCGPYLPPEQQSTARYGISLANLGGGGHTLRLQQRSYEAFKIVLLAGVNFLLTAYALRMNCVLIFHAQRSLLRQLGASLAVIWLYGQPLLTFLLYAFFQLVVLLNRES